MRKIETEDIDRKNELLKKVHFTPTNQRSLGDTDALGHAAELRMLQKIHYPPAQGKEYQ